jgi:hypothetical protein
MAKTFMIDRLSGRPLPRLFVPGAFSEAEYQFTTIGGKAKPL